MTRHQLLIEFTPGKPADTTVELSVPAEAGRWIRLDQAGVESVERRQVRSALAQAIAQSLEFPPGSALTVTVVTASGGHNTYCARQMNRLELVGAATLLGEAVDEFAQSVFPQRPQQG